MGESEKVIYFLGSDLHHRGSLALACLSSLGVGRSTIPIQEVAIVTARVGLPVRRAPVTYRTSNALGVAT
jgi:hypothetical protein